jgi:hypothetical protein
VAVALGACAAGARAQEPFDGTQALDAYTGPVVTEGRIVGLGGAFVAVGEGIGGAVVNPAAVAQQRRDLDRTWDLGGTFTWYVPAVAQIGNTDLGNDGRADGELAAVGIAQLGGLIQLGSLGLGIVATAWEEAVRRPGADAVFVATSDVSIVGGWSSPREVLALGVALTVGTGEVGLLREADLKPTGQSVRYAGSRLRFGGLVRPRGEPWRLGFAWDPGAVANPRGNRDAVPVPTPARFEFPWIVSAGVSRWLGPNARHYNEPSMALVWLHPEWGAPPAWEATTRRPILLTVQADLVGPTPGAVTVESALIPDRPVVRSGGRAAVAVRVGAEWEAWSRVLRGRIGSYVEPSRPGADVRVHGTFGLDLRLPFWPWDLQLSAAADAASLYRNVTLSLGFWSETGPMPPAAW